MNRTSIEWCTHTVNPIRFRNKETGKVGHYCEKISPGCRNCYASRMQAGPYLSGLEFRVENRDKGELFFDEAVLQQVLRRRKPAVIFWCDCTDLFGDWVPDEWLDRCAAVVALTPHLKHLWLTKRAKRMREWVGYRSEQGRYVDARILDAADAVMLPDDIRSISWDLPGWPLPNLGLGVSCEDQKTADERIPDLLATPAAMRFVSVEPMLSGVDLKPGRWMPPLGGGPKCNLMCPWEEPLPSLDWAICGGESGPGARPTRPDHVRSLRDQCVSAGVPYFHKQNGEWFPHGDASRDQYEDVPVGDGTHHRMFRVGKKSAGRLLDGLLWDQRPEGWG